MSIYHCLIHVMLFCLHLLIHSNTSSILSSALRISLLHSLSFLNWESLFQLSNLGINFGRHFSIHIPIIVYLSCRVLEFVWVL